MDLRITALLLGRIILLFLKLASGCLALVVLHMKGSDMISLGLLTGFQWIGFIIHLSIVLIPTPNIYFKWCATLSEFPTLGISLWWIDSILRKETNLINQSNRNCQTSLATLIIITSCLNFFLRPEINIENEFGNNQSIEKPNVFQNLLMKITNKSKQNEVTQENNNHSIINKSKDQLIFDFSNSSSSISFNNNNNNNNNIPLKNPIILPNTPPSSHQKSPKTLLSTKTNMHTQFNLPLLPPITISNFTENENDIHSLNIPQISTSPIRKRGSINSIISSLSELQEKGNENTDLKYFHEDYSQTNDILNSYAELDDDDFDLYDTLNKEIKSNISIVRHQTSVPNLPSELNNQQIQIVRHSRSHSLINVSRNQINNNNNNKHTRTSSYSPIKKFSKSFKDSFSIDDSSSHTFNFHSSNQTQCQKTDDFELNLDLVKSIQKSPKKKRSLNHSRLASINEPIENPILLSFDNSNSNEKRVISNSSIPDGYFSAYDREKWQAIKNMS